jgi:nucleoside-diphosphate-sugar epimerase
MKILFFGGTGFVGFNIAGAPLARGQACEAASGAHSRLFQPTVEIFGVRMLRLNCRRIANRAGLALPDRGS